MNMKLICVALAATSLMTVQATAQETVKTDTELRAAIEKHTWYSHRHGYRFLPNGIIAVDGYPTKDETWTIQNGLLYRKENAKRFADFAPTKIIVINDGQLVEQDISGQHGGSVEIMYSNRP
jgi:hypothetical protein